MLKDVRGGELRDRSPAGFDRKGCRNSESGTEFGTLELPALQRTWLVFGSIAVEIAAPGAASNRPSPTDAVGSELMVGADT